MATSVKQAHETRIRLDRSFITLADLKQLLADIKAPPFAKVTVNSGESQREAWMTIIINWEDT